MKRLLPVLLIAASKLAFGSEPWDGTHGDITLSTQSSIERNPNITFPTYQTTFKVTCSNAAVTAVRLKVIYSDPVSGFTGIIIKTFDLGLLGGSSVTLTLNASLITTPPQITELFDGGSVAF